MIKHPNSKERNQINTCALLTNTCGGVLDGAFGVRGVETVHARLVALCTLAEFDVGLEEEVVSVLD